MRYVIRATVPTYMGKNYIYYIGYDNYVDIFASRKEAARRIKELDSQRYTTGCNEAGRPVYRLVPETQVPREVRLFL